MELQENVGTGPSIPARLCQQEGTCSHWGPRQAGLEEVEPQSHEGTGHMVLARFVLLCCGRRTRAEGWPEGACAQESMWVGHTISKIGRSVCAMLLSAGGPVFSLGGGAEKLHRSAPSFLEKSFMDPCLSSSHSEISKQIFLQYNPGDFQTAASMLCLTGAFCCAVSLRVGTQFHLAFQALPEPNQQIFQVPGFKSWCL